MTQSAVLVLERGEDWEQDIIWSDFSDVPIDLANYTAKMDVKRHYADISPTIELTEVNNRIVLDAVDGLIQLKLSATETESFAANDFDNPYVFDLMLIEEATLAVTKVLKGKLFNRPNATTAV